MKLGFVNVSPITPHREIGYQTDLAATLELVDYLCSAGVHGIVLLGSTGEFVHMSLEDRAHLVRLAVKRSRVPVIVGVTHSTLDGTISLAEDAAKSGAVAVLAMPPYFFPYGQPEVREFYVQLAARLAGSIPILLYNIPPFTSEIAVETSRELLTSGSFSGIKDSSGNIDTFSKLRAQKESTPFTLLVGSDRIFARARRDGADGIVSGVACAIPELLLALDRSIQAGDSTAAARLDSRLQEFLGWLDRFPSPVGVKVACASRGLKVGPLAVPLSAAEGRRLDEFRSWLKDYLPDVLRECQNTPQKS